MSFRKTTSCLIRLDALTLCKESRPDTPTDNRPFRGHNRETFDMDMREHIKEQSSLAHTYAEDGAYRSAARVLEKLAKEVSAHADRLYDELDAMGTKPK